MKSIKSYGMQWIWHWFRCLSGLSEATRAVFARSVGALGGHLTIFNEIFKKTQIASMPFSDHFEQMINIIQVLEAFLKSHNEAHFEPYWKNALVRIHLRGELPYIFIDFDVFHHKQKVVIFAQTSVCVDRNAMLTCQNWASPSKKWFFGMRTCSFLIHTHVDVKSSYEVLWRPHGQK